MIYDTYTLDDLEKVVRYTTKTIRPHVEAFDAIVVSGLSGLSVGSPASLRLKKPLVVVRKPTENAHTSVHPGLAHLYRPLTSLSSPPKRWLFLDDFMSTGATLRRCKDAVASTKAVHVGNFFYNLHPYEVKWVKPEPVEPEPPVMETDAKTFLELKQEWTDWPPNLLADLKTTFDLALNELKAA